MKIYTIAYNKRECFGHGDYGNVLSIQKLGGYGVDGFPLFYTSKAKAEAYFDSINRYKSPDMVLVELELIEDPIEGVLSGVV